MLEIVNTKLMNFNWTALYTVSIRFQEVQGGFQPSVVQF